jgi:hypothetical protein
MWQREGQVSEDFTDPNEMFYRRCPPFYIHDSGVDEAAVKEHNLSVLRSKYAEPDHARWESRHDCHDREPLVYPEYSVIEFPESAIPPEKSPPDFLGAPVHRFRPAHVPFADNYAHSEVHILRGDKHVEKERDLTGEGKRARRFLQVKLAEAARVRLQPWEGSPLHPGTFA